MPSTITISILLGARLGLLAGFLLAAVITDTAARKIPNKLVLGGLAVAFLCQGLFFGGSGLLDGAKGMGLGFVLFLPLYLLRAMGAGDVKLMAMVGAFTGMQDIVGIVLFTFVAGGVLSLAFALKLKSLHRLINNMKYLTLAGMSKVAAGKMPVNDFPVNSIGTLPYAWAITLGTAGYFVWRSL
ncbi:A24 family peptidase [Pseudogulbenkiania ferrooxidans]|uniref:Peptidase A24A prepilin type IV n=1 Tax=Pseudogulbenkiania ferrooxidans 2002 TaxID=279714 RepID=B9YZS1_9NEIS|nr:A24 family peptidase [Pseudogulbenkiania ferrooxidans]EEG09804.1 peptidase A24A prepilin type IV [Pseudogulbenkiania ferrooxidans 2002]